MIVARDKGGREAVTEGEKAGDVGMTRIFCGLAKFNQQLDQVFVEPTKGFGDEGKEDAVLLLHLRVIFDDLAVGTVQGSVTPGTWWPGWKHKKKKHWSVQRTSQWRVPLPYEGGRSRRQAVFRWQGCTR